MKNYFMLNRIVKIISLSNEHVPVEKEGKTWEVAKSKILQYVAEQELLTDLSQHEMKAKFF